MEKSARTDRKLLPSWLATVVSEGLCRLLVENCHQASCLAKISLCQARCACLCNSGSASTGKTNSLSLRFKIYSKRGNSHLVLYARTKSVAGKVLSPNEKAISIVLFDGCLVCLSNCLLYMYIHIRRSLLPASTHNLFSDDNN